MTMLLTACAVFALLTLYFLFSMGRHARRGRPIRATRSLVGGAATGAMGGASFMVIFSYFGYAQLVDEQVVGRIQFERSSLTEYEARLMLDNGERDKIMTLTGDEWQLDARVVTWKPPATILGLDPIYQLDRLSGRYSDVDDEMVGDRTVHSLSEPGTLDLWQFAQDYPSLLPGVDAHYGTATFLPMAHGALYEVRMTRTGLIARPLNDAAEAAVGEW